MNKPQIQTGGALTGAPLILPDPEAQAKRMLYTSLHCCDRNYQTRNQGLASRNKWLGMIERARSILEIGCGNGLLCQALSQTGWAVTGVDLVTGPYPRPGYAFAVCDMTREELPRGFDAALCFDVLEHLEDRDIDAALNNIGLSAQAFVFTIAGYGVPPVHPTVKSPGWWLNKFFAGIPGRSWLVEIFERYEQQPSPVYLFMGNVPNV